MSYTSIDTSAVKADSATSTAIPAILAANIVDHNTERHVACSWGAYDDGPVEFSTHPDAWAGRITMIPRAAGATHLRCRIVYSTASDSSTATAKAKLRIGLEESAEITLAAAQTKTLSGEISLPLTSLSQWSECKLLFQSQPEASSVAKVSIWEIRDNGLMLCEKTGGTLTTGKTGYLLDITSTTYADTDRVRTRYYCGHIDARAGATYHDHELMCWPPPAQPNDMARGTETIAKVDAGDVYSLARIKIHGVLWYMDGDSGAYDLALYPRGPGQPVDAAQLATLQTRAERLYAERARWLTCGPSPTITSDWYGVLCDSAATIVAIWDLVRRADVTGVEVVIVWATLSSQAGQADVTFDLHLAGLGVATDATETVSQPLGRPPYAGMLETNLGMDEWGAADLVDEWQGEVLTRTVIRADYPTGAVGDAWMAYIETSGGRVAVLSVSAREAV